MILTTSSVATGLALVVLMAATAAKADLPRQLGYGSRAGMSVTVTSSRGLGTANAVIVGRHTEANAREFCIEYSGDRSDACVSRQLRETKLKPFITADCDRGAFTTFYGGHYLFVGPHRKTGDDFLSLEYDIVDLSTNEVLDGTSASGYSYVLEQFKALCPGKAR